MPKMVSQYAGRPKKYEIFEFEKKGGDHEGMERINPEFYE